VVAASGPGGEPTLRPSSPDQPAGASAEMTPADPPLGGDTADLRPRSTPTRALRAVPMGAALEDAEFGMLEDARDVLPARRRRRPQLRLVK